MKDLYHKLELEPAATREEIAAAFEKRPELKAYSTILLDDEKRELYDQVHKTLKMIGALRFRLDLDKSDSWFIHRHPDFATMPKPKLGEVHREAPRPPKTPPPRRRRLNNLSGWLLPLVILLIVAAAIGVILIL
jgi:hypothetical protein